MQTPNAAGWPDEVRPVFNSAVTCEWATMSKSGTPITWPVTPYLGADGRTIDVSTGLTYPAKADRARRDPRVALLFSDPLGSGLTNPPVVLVQGLATVRDRDLQAGADRYIRLGMAKLPASYKGQPRFLLRRQAWYFTRIWVLVTPLRILWWPGGNLDAAPQRWDAPAGTSAPPSDPPPQGPSPGAWQAPAPEWRTRAARAVELGAPVLTVAGADGYPLPCRMRGAGLRDTGFALQVPRGMPEPAEGPGCLTFHTHAEQFAGQENIVFVGRVHGSGAEAQFEVDRLLPDFSLPGGKLQVTLAFMRAARQLTPRLKQEAARRGQPVPEVRLPT
ncbi:MAG TPA: pyridoxamine 5'-phosphate oxidase family protein [Chloroflexia bacterium]|nr:pyridoxamine 5'-phosphate oxidase family protein [Chloroflexia bacterium]